MRAYLYAGSHGFASIDAFVERKDLKGFHTRLYCQYGRILWSKIKSNAALFGYSGESSRRACLWVLISLIYV